MTAQAGSARGLFESLTALASTLLAMAQTRLALLSVEIETQCQHWLVIALLALGGLLLFAGGLVLGTLSLVAAFWDSHRVLVLALTAGGYGLAGIAVWAWLLHRLRSRPTLFAASLAELAKDRQPLAVRR